MPEALGVAKRARAIWLILIGKAQDRQVLTYKALGKMMSLGPRNLTWSLARVTAYCNEKKYPNLTTIVVKQEAGLPGPGLVTVHNKTVESENRGEAFSRERERVFRRRWYELDPPTPAELEQAWKKEQAEKKRKKERGAV